MWNNRGPADVRRVFTGKDALLFDEDGTLLATIETFQGQVNVTNAKYQPLGDAQEHEAFQSYSVTLTVTEVVIEDERFIQEMFNDMTTGTMPNWMFQGVIKGRNGSEERMIYRDCVPSGNIDLQNASVGDLIKRQWSMFVNRPPELQKLLSYSS